MSATTYRSAAAPVSTGAIDRNDPKYAPYVAMAQLGIPDESIKASMLAVGLTEQHFRQLIAQLGNSPQQYQKGRAIARADARKEVVEFKQFWSPILKKLDAYVDEHIVAVAELQQNTREEWKVYDEDTRAKLNEFLTELIIHGDEIMDFSVTNLAHIRTAVHHFQNQRIDRGRKALERWVKEAEEKIAVHNTRNVELQNKMKDINNILNNKKYKYEKGQKEAKSKHDEECQFRNLLSCSSIGLNTTAIICGILGAVVTGGVAPAVISGIAIGCTALGWTCMGISYSRYPAEKRHKEDFQSFDSKINDNEKAKKSLKHVSKELNNVAEGCKKMTGTLMEFGMVFNDEDKDYLEMLHHERSKIITQGLCAELKKRLGEVAAKFNVLCKSGRALIESAQNTSIIHIREEN